MFKHIYIIVLALVIISTSCNKEKNNVMPEFTTEGKNTFGAYLNGELFLPKGLHPTNPTYGNPRGTFDVDNDIVFTIGNNTDGQKILYLLADKITNDGFYDLEFGTSFRDKNLTASCEKYDLDDNANNTFEVVYFNEERRIISGRFEATFINQCDSTDIITFTEGQYDIKYKEG